MSKRKKEYWNMTADELAAATKEFKEDGVAETFRAMTAAALARLRQARRKRQRGRPRVGKGVKVISVGVELGLLERADAVAKKRGLSRAKLIAEGLESVLSRRQA